MPTRELGYYTGWVDGVEYFISALSVLQAADILSAVLCTTDSKTQSISQYRAMIKTQFSTVWPQSLIALRQKEGVNTNKQSCYIRLNRFGPYEKKM